MVELVVSRPGKIFSQAFNRTGFILVHLVVYAKRGIGKHFTVYAVIGGLVVFGEVGVRLVQIARAALEKGHIAVLAFFQRSSEGAG